MDTLQDLFEIHLEDQFDAENQVLDLMPRLIAAISSPRLRQALNQMYDKSIFHLDILSESFQSVGKKPGAKMSQSMEAIIFEVEEMMPTLHGKEFKDSALVAFTIRMQFYLLAGYSILQSMAKKLEWEVLSQRLTECRQDTWRWIIELETWSKHPEAIAPKPSL